MITAWGNFDAKHPDGSVEDFCRHYLMHKTERQSKTWDSKHWPVPVTIDFALLRLTGRIAKLNNIYAITAAEGTGIGTLDEFSLLNAIDNLKDPRKTEAIYTALFELSTGIDMLNRLKKIGFISEHADKEDKRSKRVKITPKGQKALVACRKKINQLAELEFYDLSDDEKKVCIQLLGKIDKKFSGLWLTHKSKPFEEIYHQVITGSSEKKLSK